MKLVQDASILTISIGVRLLHGKRQGLSCSFKRFRLVFDDTITIITTVALDNKNKFRPYAGKWIRLYEKKQTNKQTNKKEQQQKQRLSSV